MSNRTRNIVIVALLVVVLFALAAAYFVNVNKRSALPAPAPVVLANTPTTIPTASPQPTATAKPVLEPTAQPTATQQTVAAGAAAAPNPTVLCENPIDGPVVFDVLNNMDVGDPSYVSVVYASNKISVDAEFFAVIEAMSNLDFESMRIQGNFWHFASLDGAECYARMMAKDLAVSNLLYVGVADAPQGFTSSLPLPGWKMYRTMYTESAIEVPGAIWPEPIVYSVNEARSIAAFAYVYGQFWDGLDASHVFHFTVEPGYRLETPNLQGTVWPGVVADDTELLLKRFAQMTFEVLERDDNPVVTQIYCGENAVKAEGWDCVKN